jgi:D-alanyl-lipoteichoic acid acyltransferase DltB (MBOAT superfamily)
LIAGLAFNIGLLGYYKYADFFISTLNGVTGSHFNLLHLLLPLGISFFTFQQIAYLVDTYRGEAREYRLLNYALFVSFFPQLVAGPIVHHREMMGQFEDKANKRWSSDNVARGLFIFVMGLAKKVLIADTFGVWATYGFDTATSLTLIEGWVTSLSYSLQLYFDFSGYTDMAIGAALMFNIVLPINFFSPYKALTIQDFWRRWHMTLSRFLRDYIYIPLGGSRQSEFHTYRNTLITFLIGGLWHGAGWTFVFWGFLHGLALVINRFWRKLGISLPNWLSWLITFNFVNAAWVFFRAETWADAIKVLRAMVGLNGVALPSSLADSLGWISSLGVSFQSQLLDGQLLLALPAVLVFMTLVITLKNSIELKDSFRAGWANAAVIIILATASILSLTRVSEFLYFNF